MEDLHLEPNVFTIVFRLVIGAAAIIGPITFIVRWVLRPIDLAAKAHRAPPRFSVGDFLCLFLAIQIPLSVIYRYVHNDDAMDYFWIFTITTWLVGPLIWITGARTLSKAGIHSWSHRFVFL